MEQTRRAAWKIPFVVLTTAVVAAAAIWCTLSGKQDSLGHSLLSDEQPIGKNVPPKFPVLVLTPGKNGAAGVAHMVYYDELQDFLGKNPMHSFLVPDGADDELNQQLKGTIKWPSPSASGDRVFSSKFTVRHREPGKQIIHTDHSWDDDVVNEGTYVATAAGITALSQTSQRSQTFVFMVLPLIALIVFVVLAFSVRAASSRQSRADSV
jgi:hypothetical protein